MRIGSFLDISVKRRWDDADEMYDITLVAFVNLAIQI